MSNKLKIYSDKNFLQPNYTCHILIPFWGEPDEPSSPDNNRFEDYKNNGPQFIEITDLNQSDVAVYPSHITSNLKMFDDFQKLVSPKPVITFFNDDSDAELTYLENTYIFRTSFYKKNQKPREFALSAFSNDCGQFPIRKWAAVPTVSFCGQSARPSDVREKSLVLLEHSSLIKTSFIRRQGFWAGWIDKGRQKEFGLKVRNEYLQNIMNSDYVLCARGGGNFSYRLYETMMCGRIPLFINTDCILPYDFILDYKDLFPIIDINHINDIDKILISFHNNLVNTFEIRQNYLREVWKTYLSPSGFFKNISKHFNWL